MLRMSIICIDLFYLRLDGYAGGQSQGMGYSVLPMVVSLTGACGLRVIWILPFLLTTIRFFIIYIVSDFVAHYGGRLTGFVIAKYIKDT